MRVLVTGATGFIGRHVVDALLARGHTVRAAHRWDSKPDFAAEVELAQVDLASGAGLRAALSDVDVVIHAAAVMQGPRQAQYEGTVSATQNLFSAMVTADVTRLVLVSSFAVYSGRGARGRHQVDENSPVATPAAARDAYCEMKLRQESLLREAAASAQWSATVARPGFVFGPDHLWSNRLGYRFGEYAWLCVGGRAALPVSYVDNCADALAFLAEQTAAGLRVVNVVDDEPPTQSEYRERLAAGVGRPKVVIVLPWPLVHVLLRLLDRIDRLTGRRLSLPAILRLEAGRARWQPTRYGNDALRELGWSSPVAFDKAIEAATGTGVTRGSSD